MQTTWHPLQLTMSTLDRKKKGFSIRNTLGNLWGEIHKAHKHTRLGKVCGKQKLSLTQQSPQDVAVRLCSLFFSFGWGLQVSQGSNALKNTSREFQLRPLQGQSHCPWAIPGTGVGKRTGEGKLNWWVDWVHCGSENQVLCHSAVDKLGWFQRVSSRVNSHPSSSSQREPCCNKHQELAPSHWWVRHCQAQSWRAEDS